MGTLVKLEEALRGQYAASQLCAGPRRSAPGRQCEYEAAPRS